MSDTNTNQAVVAQIQERLRGVYGIVTTDIPEEHEKASASVTAIQKAKEKGPQDDKKNPNATQNYRKKLDSLYTTALEDSESEEQAIRKALEKIYEIRAIINERRTMVKHSGNKETIRRGAQMKALQTAAQTMPLWIGKPGEKAPPLCGAIPAEQSYNAKAGDMVAALQRTAEGDDNWILAEVINYHTTTGKYELDDVDEEQKEKIVLSRRRVIPLPVMRANPETNPEALYKASTIVMALYPQTTCFYKGVVSALPATHKDEYEVLFDDPTYPDGYSPPLKVAQRYVIPHRDKKAK